MIYEPVCIDVTSAGGSPRAQLQWRDVDGSIHCAYYTKVGDDDADCDGGKLPSDPDDVAELGQLAVDAIFDSMSASQHGEESDDGFTRWLVAPTSTGEDIACATAGPLSATERLSARREMHLRRATLVATTVSNYLELLAETSAQLSTLADDFESKLMRVANIPLPLEVEATFVEFTSTLRHARVLGNRMASALWRTSGRDPDGAWTVLSKQQVEEFVFCATLLLHGWRQIDVAHERLRRLGRSTAEDLGAAKKYVSQDVNAVLNRIRQRRWRTAARQVAGSITPVVEAALAANVLDLAEREHVRRTIRVIMMAPELGRALGTAPPRRLRGRRRAA